jgi:hypothetical protein
MTKNDLLFFVFEGRDGGTHSGDFSVVVRDVRQYSQQDSDALTLLWVLEGRVGLHDGDLRQPAC